MSILLLFKIIIIVLSSIVVIYVGLVARIFYDEERNKFSYKNLFWTIVSSGLFVGIIYYIDLKFGEKTAFVCAMGSIFVGALSISTIANNKSFKSLFWTIVSSGLFVGIIYYIDLKFGEKAAFVCAMGSIFVGVLSIPTIANYRIGKK